MKKKVVALLMVMAVVFAMAGCGSKEKASDVLAKAQEAGADMKSTDFTANMTLKMSSGEETLDMSIGMKGSMFVDPLKAKMEMNMDMGSQGSMDSTLYMSENDGKFYTYMNAMGQWSAQEMDAAAYEKAVTGYDNKAYLDIIAGDQDSFKVSDAEEDGKKLIKLEGKLTGDAMKKMMESTSALDSLKSAGIDTSVYDDMGDIQVTAYFEKDTYQVYKMSMDMKDLMNKIMEKSMEAAGSTEKASVDTCVMEMTYANLNAAADFEVPQEALDAAAAQ